MRANAAVPATEVIVPIAFFVTLTASLNVEVPDTYNEVVLTVPFEKVQLFKVVALIVELHIVQLTSVALTNCVPPAPTVTVLLFYL